MADQQVGNVLGVAAVDNGGGTNKPNLNGGGTGAPQGGLIDPDSMTIAAMRARLATIDAGYYTAARLNAMSVNDMRYAIRVADFPDTIKQ